MMDEQQFRDRADHALEDLNRRLGPAAEEFGFESDFNSGALSIEFEESSAKFVVSPNTPVRQVWVSAHSKSFKLDWDDVRDAFVLASTGQTLAEMIASAIGQQIGEEVTL
jgi:CyaY protein